MTTSVSLKAAQIRFLDGALRRDDMAPALNYYLVPGRDHLAPLKGDSNLIITTNGFCMNVLVTDTELERGAYLWNPRSQSLVKTYYESNLDRTLLNVVETRNRALNMLREEPRRRIVQNYYGDLKSVRVRGNQSMTFRKGRLQGEECAIMLGIGFTAALWMEQEVYIIEPTDKDYEDNVSLDLQYFQVAYQYCEPKICWKKWNQATLLGNPNGNHSLIMPIHMKGQIK